MATSIKKYKHDAAADKSPKNWLQKDKCLTRTFKFEAFPAAIAFMVEVSLFCEKTDHHPEWKNIYNTLYVELTTHDANAVTDKDRKLAAHMNKVFDRVSSL